MKKVLFRIYCLFCTLLTGLSLRAQELDDDDMGGGVLTTSTVWKA